MPAILSLPVPGLYSLPPFSPALTQDAVHACPEPLPAYLLIGHMLNLSIHLISIDAAGSFFGPRDTSPYTPSLYVLYTRLTNGYIAPSTLPPNFLTLSHTQHSTHANIFTGCVNNRPLADYQDLYYALLARIREMQQRMADHLRSGFSTPMTHIFPSGPTLAELHETLSSYWDVLNDAAAGKAMDDAVREARVQSIQDEIVARVARNVMSGEEAERQIMRIREREVYDEQMGLEWTPEWDAALVNAKLGEKYRGVFEECRRRDRKDGVKVKCLQKKMERGVEQAERSVGTAVMDVEEGAEEEFVEEGLDRAEQEWMWNVEQMQHPAFPKGFSVDAEDDEADIDRNEQQWLWRVEQMQHPAFCEDFGVDAQDNPDMELLRAKAAQICYVPDAESVQEVEYDGSMECVEISQSVQQHGYLQTQQLDGPVSASTPAVQQEDIDDSETAYNEERFAWLKELETQRQRVSQYTAYLRSRASV